MMSLPPDVDNPYKIFVGFENGLLYLNWIISLIFLLSIYEGREVSKLYIISGKINSGDRYFTLKFVLAPLFLMSLYFFFGMLLTFSVIYSNVTGPGELTSPRTFILILSLTL